MIKQSCNLIRWEHVSLEFNFNFSCWITSVVAILPSDQPNSILVSLSMSERVWAHLAHPTSSSGLTCYITVVTYAKNVTYAKIFSSKSRDIGDQRIL